MPATRIDAGTPDWQRRYRAARVTLPVWGEQAPHRAVYASNASGVWQLVSWDLTTGRHEQITDKPTGVVGGQPTPDGSGVVWFDDRAGDEVGRYVVSPFDGGTPQPLVPEAGEGWSEGLSWRSDRIAVGVSDRDGFRIGVARPDHPNADGGHACRDETGYRQVYAHRQPAGVGGLSKDGRLLAISHSEHGDSIHPAVRVLDAGDGQRLADLWDGPGNSLLPAGWSPVPGDARLAVLADESGRTRPAIWAPTTGERVALELDLPGEVWVADWWPDASALLLGHDHLGRVELFRYDLRSHHAVALPLTDGTVSGARVRDDGAVWYAFDSSSQPPQVRTRDAAGGDTVLLSPPGQPAPPGVAYTSLHYDNGDGDQVHAFLATPPGDAPFPLVVHVHGGPQAQVTDSFDARAQAWVDHGFAVLQPNYRGSTGYGKAFQDALLGDPGRPELVDVRAGRDLLVAKGVADGSRVVLAGGSWGGYLTLQGIGTQPDAWSVAVATVPVADYLAAVADESPGLQEFDRTMFGGTPQERPELYRQRSPLAHVANVTAPVLIITGANDTRCPKRQVDNYVAALAAHGKTHRYDVFEAGHGSLAIDELIRQQALALDFVAEHLGTPPAQRPSSPYVCHAQQAYPGRE